MPLPLPRGLAARRVIGGGGLCAHNQGAAPLQRQCYATDEPAAPHGHNHGIQHGAAVLWRRAQGLASLLQQLQRQRD